MIDYVAVAYALAADLTVRGGDLRLNTELVGLQSGSGPAVIQTTTGEIVADEVFVCAGLQSARVAALVGEAADPRIIPFRGEYYRLTPSAAALVRGLIYPVPDPRYPFLGIHLTRRIDGSVDVGPNAVLALALEGYRRRDIDLHDLRDIVTWPGVRRVARAHWRAGARELLGSASKHYYLAQARHYLPALTADDLVAADAGVRAQAISRNGALVDDFVISRRAGLTMVRNAPSPAATSSLAIAEYIVRDSGACG
jgi:L-2-hydroxyglutarate oxidase LhgO